MLKSNLVLATPLPVALRRDDALSFEASVMAKFEIPATICNFLLICWIQTNLFPLALARGSTIPSTESIPQRDNLRDSGLVLVKIGCLIILFVGTFLAGISPYFCKWNYAFLVLGTQFAGGVFLATALIHFLSDANSTFQEHTNVDYPFAFMLATAGYLVTMYGDCLIQWIMTHESAAGRVKFDKVNAKSELEAVGAETELSAINIANSSPKEKQCCEREDLTNSELKISQLFTSAASDDKCSCSGESLKCCTCTEEFNETDDVQNIVKATLIQTASFGDSILLIVALCFHSLFEGIAIGVAETKIDAWKALWTIFLHKIFAAIAMGIALLRMIPDRPFISSSAYSFFFCHIQSNWHFYWHFIRCYCRRVSCRLVLCDFHGICFWHICLCSNKSSVGQGVCATMQSCSRYTILQVCRCFDWSYCHSSCHDMGHLSKKEKLVFQHLALLEAKFL